MPRRERSRAAPPATPAARDGPSALGTPASAAVTAPRRIGDAALGPCSPVCMPSLTPRHASPVPEGAPAERDLAAAAGAEGPDPQQVPSNLEAFKQLVTDHGVWELDGAKCATRKQTEAVLAMLGGCIDCFPQEARQKRGDAVKANLKVEVLRAALIAKMQQEGFAGEMQKARERVEGSRELCAWSPGPDTGPGAASNVHGLERSGSRQPYQSTPGRFCAKQTARTAAQDFVRSGRQQDQQGRGVFSDGLFASVRPPNVEGDPFEKAVDFALTRLGSRLLPNASATTIVQALRQKGVCKCGSACDDEDCYADGVAAVKDMVVVRLRESVQQMARNMGCARLQHESWEGSWGPELESQLQAHVVSAMQMKVPSVWPDWLTSPVKRAAAWLRGQLESQPELQKKPPAVRDALSADGSGFVRTPYDRQNCRIATTHTQMRNGGTRKGKPNYSCEQRQIADEIASGSRSAPLPRVGSRQGDEFWGGKAMMMGESVKRTRGAVAKAVKRRRLGGSGEGDGSS